MQLTCCACSTEKDIEESKKGHEAIGAYYEAKLAADRDLVKRSAFNWVILRPGHLLDEEGTGKVELGAEVHMGGVPVRPPPSELSDGRS